MNHRDQVLLRLRYARDKGVCGTTFLDLHIPRYAARVAELRTMGYTIVTERCMDGAHSHRTRQVRYRLVTTPADRVTQIALDAGLDD